MERILNMILRRLVNKGINSGMRAASRRGEDKLSPEERQARRKQQQQGKNSVRGVRQASRMMRRFTKF